MSDASPGNGQLSPLKRAYLAIERLEAEVRRLEGAQRQPIAVVGLGCRFPGAPDPESYWDLLRDGIDAVREVPDDRWDVDALYDPDPAAPGRMSTRWGGFLDRVDGFDPGFFGIAPREAASMDPQQRLLLEVAWEALEHAGIPGRGLEGTSTGVFVGLSTNDYALLQAHRNAPADLDAHYASGIADSVVAGRLSYLLGLTGPSVSLDTACSSSLVAVHLACRSLRAGESSMALAGGVNVILLPDNTIAFSSSSMMAPDGRCKAFDARADGFVRAEGCGMVVLKRLQDAVADRDRLLAVIRGSSINQDGASSGLTAPNGPSQEAVVRRALEDAGLSPSEVDYVEAHGTGTSLGDPIEAQALGNVFGPDRAPDHPLRIGSVKSNIGHCEAAAGAAGLIKLILSLRNGEVPASLHVTRPSPEIPWADYPFLQIATERTAWTGEDRVGGVSSFGFSGTNAHVVVQAAPEIPEAAGDGEERGERSGRPERPVHLLPVSARTPEALRELSEAWVATLETEPDRFPDLCHTAGAGRSHFEHRLVVAAGSGEEAGARLTDHLEGRPARGVAAGEKGRGDPPRIAFLFTGQGAQHPDMGRELYETHPVFRRAMDRCSEILEPRLDRRLLDLLYGEDRDADLLSRTAYTQPALFALEYALAELWRSWGVEPDVVLGHSIGEYAAACVAGVFGLEDGLALVTERGRLMQAMPGTGGMASVRAPAEEVAERLEPWSDSVSVACVNGPRSTVVSGEGNGLEAAVAALESEGLACDRLRVSHGFHSAQMEPMLDAFAEAAARVSYAEPRIGMVSNVTGRPAGAAEVARADYWVRHVRAPVLFRQGMESLAQQGVDLFVEVGPHATLCTMGQGCVDAPPGAWHATLRRDREAWSQVADTASALYVAGVDLDWRGFDDGFPRRIVDAPTYPFQRTQLWLDPVDGAERALPGAVYGVDDGRDGPERAPRHPLLGRETRSPRMAEVVWEGRPDPSSLAWLGDHRVFGTSVLPAAGFVEMMLAVGRRVLPPGPQEISGLSLDRALAFDREEPATVQVVATPDGDGWTVEVLGHAGGDPARTSSWVTHASARVAPTGTADAPPSLADVDARCPVDVAPTDLYDTIAEHGIDLGPAFRSLASVARSETEAVARVRLPGDVAAGRSDYVVHPALLDGGFQALAALVAEAGGADSAAYLPVGVERLVLHAAPDDELTSHVILRDDPAEDPSSIMADLRLFDGEGNPLADVRGLRLRRTSVLTAPWAHRGRISDWQYRVEWRRRSRRDPAPRPEPEAAPASPERIAGELSGTAGDLAVEHGLTAYGDLLPEMDELVAAVVVRALDRLGWEGRTGDTVRPAELAEELGVDRRHRRLLGRLLGFLAERRLLEEEGDGAFRVVELPSTEGLQERIEELKRRHPEGRAELTLIGRAAPRLGDCLAGSADPLEVLFPGGGLDVADELYRRSPPARVFNELARAAVEELVEGWPADRGLRVLEVGAGTGGTTSFLLPALPEGRTDYLYTDVSPHFVTKARDRFADHPFVDYRVLDLEEDPAVSGVPGGSFDLVVAANVVHATSDLARTMAHVRQYLAPGGVALLLEGTRPQAWIDVTFGLTEGWWAFNDTDLRPDYPLLDRGRWEAVLERAGFDEVAVIPGADADPTLTDNAVILARCPGRGTPSAPVAEADAAAPPAFDTAAARAPEPIADEAGVPDPVLLFRDREGVGDAVARSLREGGATVVEVTAGTGPGRDDDRGRRLDPTEPEGYRSLLQQLEQEGLAPRTIVHLWALDTESQLSSPTGEVAAAQEGGTRSVLHLVQALAEAPSHDPRLYVATRRARAAGPGPVDPAQAPLWGLARVVELEHPELATTMVDLEGEIPVRDARHLYGEIASGEAEPLVAYRRDERLVARLAPAPLAPPAPRGPDEVRDLACGTPGVIDSLTYVRTDVAPPRPGEVQIRVHSTGLNFRDVLVALGMYPEPGATVGGECAGEVVAVGPGVESLTVGDPVMAMASGGFGTVVNAREELAAKVPPGVSLTRAATIPSAFVTATHALLRLAGLRRGESVLVHAGAGGVGQAAVQIARSVGAEIFATAGSEEKRAHLRQQGVDHVFHSRTLEFVEQVREATGGAGVDVVLNSLADDFVEASFSLVREGGRFVELGKRGILTEEEAQERRPDVDYHVVDLAAAERDPAAVGEILRSVAERLEVGEIAPLPVQRFGRDEVVEAFRFMTQARHVGKIVVTRDEDRAGAGDYPERGLRPDATYLVTGGTGGLGIEVARWMAAGGARHLALLGRREPGPAAREAVAELKERGVEVALPVADVAAEASLSEALDEVRTSLPPLAGVVHAAGVLRDGVLVNQSWERFAEVLAPKMEGSWNLHRLTRGDDLDFFVLFSSISSLLGSPGQGNHAAANAFLDALAEARSDAGLPAQSIGWGVWSEVGAAAEKGVGERVEGQGMGSMTPDEGVAALGLFLLDGRTTGAVMPVDWTRFLADAPGRMRDTFFDEVGGTEAPSGETATAAAGVLERLEALPEARRVAALADWIREHARAVLGLETVEAVPADQPLQELGLDSLMAVELRNILRSGLDLGTSLPATLVFDYPTVDELARHLAGELLGWTNGSGGAGSDGDGAGATDAGDDLADALARLETLSDEQVSERLRDRTTGGS